MVKLLYDKKQVNTNNEILFCGYCVTIVSADCTAFNIVKRLLCTYI